MEENKGVITDSPSVEETVVLPVAKAEEPQKPPKGFVPYQALEEERRLRKEAEEEAERLKNLALSAESDDVFSDEGKALKGEISVLNQKLSDIEKKEARREVENEFPILKDKKDEFNEFLDEEENKRISIKKAAKLFLAEKNLLVSEPERKGLETPTSGGNKPEPGLSDEEKEHIRKTDFRKYAALLQQGKI